MAAGMRLGGVWYTLGMHEQNNLLNILMKSINVLINVYSLFNLLSDQSEILENAL